MRIVATIVNIAAYLYIAVLFARLILDIVPIANRGWRPKGAGLVAAVAVFAVTDPPLKLARRVIRPVRMGGVALDLAFSVVLLLAWILTFISGALARL